MMNLFINRLRGKANAMRQGYQFAFEDIRSHNDESAHVHAFFRSTFKESGANASCRRDLAS